MKLEDARDIMRAWEKEVAHADFRYLSKEHVAAMSTVIEESFTLKWVSDMPPTLRCPQCCKLGFRTRTIWSAVQELARLKCDKCGEWATVTEWDRATKEATR